MYSDAVVGDLERMLAAYQRGDAAAFRELLHAASGRLHRFLGMTAGFHMADDLLQQTWLEVHRARATYDPRRAAMPWLFAVARHTAFHALRGHGRAAVREAAVREVAATTSGASTETDVAVREAMARLPDVDREVVALLHFAELSVAEVARVVGSSEGAVKQRAHRAYAKLRGLLGETSPVILRERL